MTGKKTPKQRPSLLLIGPRIRPGVPLGGAVVLFEQLVDYYESESLCNVRVIDTSRKPANGWLRKTCRRAAALIRTVAIVFRHAPWCDVVVLNASCGGALGAGPVLWAVACLWRKPFVTRLFGGSFDLFYDRASVWQRFLAEKTFIGRGVVLVETRDLCRCFGEGARVQFFPNTRDLIPIATRRSACTRFLFLSQLRPQKGIREALAASDRLPAGCTLDVYGPCMPGIEPEVFSGHPHATYRGTVRPSQVPDVLASHDVLLFPTYYQGEGMPGAVIEAQQAGMPVIASRWRSLGELIDNGVNGFLTEPRSVDELAQAMERLVRDPDLFARMSRRARERGETLRSHVWNARFHTWMTELAERPAGGPPSRMIAARSPSA